MSPASQQSSGEPTTCPWCSGAVPAEAATCPSCGASLRDAADGDVLGVTQVDPGAASRLKRMTSGGIATFLGVSDGPTAEGPRGKVEPPSDEVRREMLRLELAAIDAELEAKAKELEAQRAVAEAEHGQPPDDAPTAKSG